MSWPEHILWLWLVCGIVACLIISVGHRLRREGSTITKGRALLVAALLVAIQEVSVFGIRQAVGVYWCWIALVGAVNACVYFLPLGFWKGAFLGLITWTVQTFAVPFAALRLVHHRM